MPEDKTEGQLRLAQQLAQQNADNIKQSLQQTGLDEEAINRNRRLLAARRELLQIEIELTKQTQGAGSAAVSSLEAQLVGLNRIIASANKLGSSYDAITNNIRGMMGINNQWRTNTIASFNEIRLHTGGFTNAIKETKAQMGALTNQAEFQGQVILKLQEAGTLAFGAVLESSRRLYTAIDDGTVGFVRATGALQRFATQIQPMESRLKHLGVTAQEVSQSMGALYGNTSAFSRMTKDTREIVLETTSLLTKMGISAETQASSFELLTMSMGQTGPQAAAINRELMLFAQQSEISTTRMLDGWVNVGPQLIKFGSRATQVYKQLAIVAKQTGLEVNRLVQYTSKFDKFDSAAESVGHLNAILGGPFLNTMQMVMTTSPVERMQMLAGAVQQAGKSFEQLTYYERLAITEGMGLQDVNELALVMRGRFDLVSGATQKSGREIERLAVQTKAFNTIQQEFAQIMRMVAIEFGPLIGSVKAWLEAGQEMMPVIRGIIAALVTLRITMLALSFTLMVSQLSMVLGPLGLIATAVSAAAAAFGSWHYIMNEKRNSPTFAESLDQMPGKIDRLAVSFGRLGSESEQLNRVTNSFGQLAYAMNSVPKSQIEVSTKFVEEYDQLASRANRSFDPNLGTMFAMARQQAPRTIVKQPMDINLNINKERLQRTLVVSEYDTV
mgnify:FL=1|tara:strand:- start:9645 stop:11657 length:2013 start_codon:yes stop_codon:yes gene_type:complete